MTVTKIIARASVSALALTAIVPAFAQSTGTQVFDQPQIVVTGARGPQQVGGVSIPDTVKTRQVLTQAFITHQTPGQSIDDIINQMPGVSFQNNDGYGASGGFLTIRGFDASRISQTFDGIPLNDTGNYAIYSNQQLDPELIDQVNVSLGSSDIDSPSPSATGSTVNYTTRNPTEDFHVRMQGSIGEYDMLRLFGVVDTGSFTKYGTRAWIAASDQTYNSPFNNFGKLNKQQYNAKIYQPIGSGGDFVSVGVNWNVNRNNSSASVPLRTDLTQSPTNPAPRVVGTGTNNRFPINADERFYDVATCTRPTPVNGTAQVETSTGCGTSFDYRFNPSRTGNIRVNSRFGLTDKLILTVDPFAEYTDANGGGTVQASEGRYINSKKGGSSAVTPSTGFVGIFNNKVYAGEDLNGDGDTLDTVNVLAPSNTITHRYGVIANLLYNFTDTQTFRLNYTLDYGRHRQTGEIGLLDQHGNPLNVFPQSDPLRDGNGNILQKRDRLSLAILNQVSGQYRGRFFDDKLTIEGGARAAFFDRKLNNHCFTTSGGGFVDCAEDPSENAAYAALNPQFAAPQKRTYHFNKVLPSAGLTYQLVPTISVYASYSKGLQVPGTDQLYNAFFFPQDNAAAQPKPETSDNFDAGVRMRSGKIQAQFAGWYTIFKNRIESTYDPILQLSTFTNLGTVHKYGFDGSVSYQIIPQLSVYAFGSYLKSKILDNVQINGAASVDCSVDRSGANATQLADCAFTKGKRESNAPTYTFGGRAEGNVGPFELGIQVKRTGPRYLNDQNTPLFANGLTNPATFGAKTPAYTLVDLDARFSLKALGMNDRTWVQFNVTNLFDKFYVGASSTSNSTASNTSVPFIQIGAPRTISGTINFGF